MSAPGPGTSVSTVRRTLSAGALIAALLATGVKDALRMGYLLLFIVEARQPSVARSRHLLAALHAQLKAVVPAVLRSPGAVRHTQALAVQLPVLWPWAGPVPSLGAPVCTRPPHSQGLKGGPSLKPGIQLPQPLPVGRAAPLRPVC